MEAIAITERLILRRWRDEDREAFAHINADPRVMEFFPHLLSCEESNAMVDRIEDHFQQRGFGLGAAALRDNGTFIGFIGLNVPTFQSAFTPCVEVGWRIAREHWGKGLATEGAREVVRYGFQTIGLGEIVAFTVPDNRRSRRVMEKLGMTNHPRDDFEHPALPQGHRLRRHVLYRLTRAGWTHYLD